MEIARVTWTVESRAKATMAAMTGIIEAAG
jgi:hypothetical protein